MTTGNAVTWRAFVGPRWMSTTDAAFWDWSALTLSAYTPAPADSTLTAGLAVGGTVATLATGTGWPSTGGLWLGPNAAGEAWEYVLYTGRSGNTLTGLRRETVDAEQTGAHTAGAVARFWWPLTTDDGKFTLTETLNDTLNVVDWSTQLAGFTFPQAALRNGHFLLLQTRWLDDTTGWGAWTNALLGWLDSPHARGDLAAEGSWTVNVLSAFGMAGRQTIGGIRAGALDLAPTANITASSTLATPRKMAGTGEFTAATPDLSTAALTDGNAATGWLSERLLGTANVPGDGAGEFRFASYGIDQVHVTRYAGQSKGYRWLAILCRGASVEDQGVNLVDQDRYFPLITSNPGMHTAPQKPFSAFPGDGKLLILCENLRLFREENPDCDADIWEVSDTTTVMHRYAAGDWANMWRRDASTVAAWWDRLAATGGGLRCIFYPEGWKYPAGDVIWGTITPAYVATTWAGLTGAYQSPQLSAPTPGQTLRRQWATAGSAAGGWAVDANATPGYFLGATPAEKRGDAAKAAVEHLLIELPSLGLTLAADVTDAAPGPGDTLLVSLLGEPGVDGLDASGTVQIGAEQITYSAKAPDYGGVIITARGANGTTAAAHSTGDAVAQVVGGVALDCPPLKSVGFTRPAGLPLPKAFVIRASQYDAVRGPEDEGYTADWTTLATETANASANYTLTLGTAARYRWVIIELQGMTTTPYRAALNGLILTVDPAVYRSDTHLAATTAANVVKQALTNAGLPAGALTVGLGSDTLSNSTTARDTAATVAADLCDFAGLRLDVGRDRKLTITVDPYWGITGLPAADLTWTTLTAGAYEADWRTGSAIAQIELEWQLPDGTVQPLVRYPALAATTGALVHSGPYCYATLAAAQAAAQKRYWQLRRPYGSLIEAVGAPWTVRAGQVHGVTWPLAAGMLAVKRVYLAQQVTHQIADMALSTAVNMLQISREDER